MNQSFPFPNLAKIFGPGLRRCGFLALMLFPLTGLLGQSASSGVIQGRVLDATTGSYLTNARVTIKGANRETFTDQYGFYLLQDVPVGPATVGVSFTGLAAQEIAVNVTAGKPVVQDVNLGAIGEAARAGTEPVVLDPFVVSANKVMAGAAIAINEQRYAPNVKVVVSSDEFGDITDGNVGEFLQYLPGVTADNNGSSEPKVISIYGLPAGSTPIMVNGFRLASASESNLSRQVYLADNSINSMSRIEVNLSNTADQPADAIGGSVNMITRNAFEYAKPSFNFRAYVSARDGQGLLKSTPGPKTTSSNKTAPGFDFTYIKPINSRLGITINASHNEAWGPQEYEGKNWSGAGTNIAVPGLTTTQLVSAPFMYRYNPMLGQGYTNRNAIGATVDYKLTDRDSLSFAYIFGTFDLAFFNRAVTFNVGSVPDATSYGPTFTHGTTGAGLISLTTGAGQSASFRHESGITSQPVLVYRHNGPVWKIDGGISLSKNTNHYRDTADGFFQALEVTMGKNSATVNGSPNNGVTNPLSNGSPITISYDNIAKNNASITVLDASGNPVDPNNLNNYTIRSATSNPRDSTDVVRSAHLNAQRSIDFSRAILNLKTGFDVRQESRDITSLVDGHGPQTWTFVGADGLPGTADDSAGVLADPTFSSRRFPLGGPLFTYPSPFKLYQLYQAHPEYFVANTLGEYINDANNAAFIRETVPAVYLQGELKLFHNRLQLVGGARYEWTKDEGEGLLRTSSTTPTTLAQAQTIYIPRGLHVTTRYGDLYPSVNATITLRPNTLLRLAYGRTLYRPDFNNILPGITLPTGGTGTINLNNTKLTPWTADNYNIILEHYFDQSAGVFSVGAFRRNIKNFFATLSRPITADDEATYNIDPAIYGNDQVSTLVNVSSAYIAGFHYEYKQSLTFLPDWARGVQFFTNGTIQHLGGPASFPSSFAAGGSSQTNFTNFINQTFSTGLTLSRRQYTLQVNWLHRAIERGTVAATFTTTNGVVTAYNYTAPQNSLNIGLDYRFTKNLALFVNVRNATNYFSDNDRSIVGITPDYAKLYSQAEFNTLYVFGLKGSF